MNSFGKGMLTVAMPSTGCELYALNKYLHYW